jgi:hypothetical protein
MMMQILPPGSKPIETYSQIAICFQRGSHRTLRTIVEVLNNSRGDDTNILGGVYLPLRESVR